MPAFRTRKIPAILLVVFLLSSCGDNLTSTEHISKAKDYIDKGDPRAALIELSSAVQKDPGSVEGRWMLAEVATDMGEGARAEKEIRKAMELGLSRSSGQVTLVKALLQQGDIDRVLQESSAPVPETSQASQATILGLRGQAYIAKGQFDSAQSAFEQALQLKSDSLPALIGMAALRGYQKHYDVSRQWVEKALKSAPTSPDAWGALGDLERMQLHYAEAEKAYDQAVKYRVSPFVEQIKRAQMRVQLKKFSAAASDIKALKEAGLKDHPYVNYIAGLNFFAQDKLEDAATAFQASHDVDPDYLPNRIYLATSHLRLGNTEQALGLAQKILADAPRSRTAHGLLGSVLISRSEYDGAKAVLQKALSATPNDPQLLGLMANVALIEGDTSEGLKYVEKLAVLEPDSEQTQNLLMLAKLMAGEALDQTIAQFSKQATASEDAYTQEFLLAVAAFRDGRLKDALDRAKALHSRYPNEVDPPKLMASVYLAARQWEPGKQELEKVLRLKPGEASATRNLAKVEAIQGNYARVKQLLAPRVKAAPKDAEATLLLANAEKALGNSSAALAILQHGAKASPTDLDLRAHLLQAELAAGHVAEVLEMTRTLTDDQLRQRPALLELRGKALLLAGNPVAATDAFEKLTKYVPNSAGAQFQYANALAARGETVRARKALEEALRLDSRYLPARIGEIKMRAQFQELDQAQKAVAKLRRDFGDRQEVLAIEGWLALGSGDFATAEQRLSVAFKKKPDSELLILLVRAQWAQKKHDLALNAMREWLRTHPNDVAVHMHLAGAYLGLARENEALASYREVVKLVPNHLPALNNLAWLNRDKSPTVAMDYAQQAFQLAPKDPYVLDTLGMLTLKSGDLGRASSLLRDAAARAPQDAQIQLHHGSVLLQQKRLDEARKVLQAVVAMAPGSPLAKEAQSLLASFERKQ